MERKIFFMWKNLAVKRKEIKERNGVDLSGEIL